MGGGDTCYTPHVDPLVMFPHVRVNGGWGAQGKFFGMNVYCMHH